MKYITLTGPTLEQMKYIRLTEGQPCKLYEIHYPYRDNPVNYMKYINPYRDNPVNYMKYIPLQGQPCKLHEIHTLTGTNL